MPSPEDKIAARALVKLGLVPEAEIGEFLEAVDEIEPEGGLLGLLVEDGRITEADRARVEKAVAAARAKAPTGAGKPAAPAAPAAPPAKPIAGKAAARTGPPKPEEAPAPEPEPRA
ncbi:MAG: hypothetical protein MUC63_05200, partial [Planctomycetes bacterium]|nr:hypothetical protein [Planctomycetota bacterium]